MLAAVGELRRTRYDATIDLQGLIKSALIARASGAPKVLGFSSRYLREPLARFLYTDVYDPGGEGIYAASEKRHVVEINLGLLEPLGIAVGKPEFPIEQAASAVAREMRDRTPGGYALLNPGAAWPNKRWPPSRLAALAGRGRGSRGRRSGAFAANVDCRCRRARARRGRHGIGGYGADPHCRGCGHADRRDLRPHAPGAQRAMVARGRNRFASRRLRVPSSPAVHARADVSARYRARRGVARRRTPSRRGPHPCVNQVCERRPASSKRLPDGE